jgi:hypothetical protein
MDRRRKLLKQKKFMDISRIKENTELTESNTRGFEVGDHINISIKFDGSNASFRYDKETGKLVAFSRKQELTYNNTLSGFWNFVQSLDANKFKNYPNYVFFGEWAVKNKIVYKPEYRKIWLMYDIYDVENECYLSQLTVKDFADKFGFTYIHVLYDGEFISWEHCKSFMNEVVYSESIEEGIVIKNQSKLNDLNSRTPFVLKIVNERFSEVMKHKIKEVNSEKEAARAQAAEIVESIVTRSRVEKEIYKMRDEGILPEKIDPSDMKLVAQNLPKRIYEDCVKEENELVMAAGEYFGKMCGNTAMRHARSIILGDVS